MEHTVSVIHLALVPPDYETEKIIFMNLKEYVHIFLT